MSITNPEPATWLDTMKSNFESPAEISLGVMAGRSIRALAAWLSARLAAERQRLVIEALTPECRNDLEALIAACGPDGLNASSPSSTRA